MHILVLDTVHGGRDIGQAMLDAGHAVDMVDVYHGTTPAELKIAKTKIYDQIVAPVHLDPDHILLHKGKTPVITHHEAVRQILDFRVPSPTVEITGARGKTTTAFALAHLLSGKGVLHTSTGTFLYPEKKFLWKKSITPASVLPAAGYARQVNGWLIAEESLGVTGAGDLAIITSPDDYVIAAGKKSAVQEKIMSAQHAKRLLVAPGIHINHPDIVYIDDVAHCNGSRCMLELEGSQFELRNRLFGLPPYRIPLMLAAVAAIILHYDPSPLDQFAALPGRMSLDREKGIIIVDNANSGTNDTTTICAARYARHCAGVSDLTLVIGQMTGDGAVCEGFSSGQIISAIDNIRPKHLIWVGEFPKTETEQLKHLKNRIDAVCSTLEEGRQCAVSLTDKGSVVLSVKTWR
jgi:UDP-N-acetylmuramyl pentapeptide synthase